MRLRWDGIIARLSYRFNFLAIRVYVVLGATHPNLVRDQGEAYRESLLARVRELGIEDHVVFLDQFVD